MKVTLYMAISANGLIAKKNDETPWSNEEWASFLGKAKEVGNILIGRRTWELMKEGGSLDKLPCSLIIVLSSRKRTTDDKRTVFVSSISEALDLAKERGFTTILVAGGSKTNTTALRSGKVNELYLDLEPWLFGKGLPLFHPLTSDFKLKFLGHRRIGEEGLQLHYKIIQWNGLTK